ncbi:MAG: alpha/beta hydrolase [Candidatus Limnocylindrales bacterium]
MAVRGAGRRVLVGLTVLSLLAGCGASATPTPGVATPPRSVSVPTPIAAPTVALALAPPASATATPTPAIGQTADDGARITEVLTIDARTRDLRIESPALEGAVNVRLLLPVGFVAQAATRWPVLYLLHRVDQTYVDWTENSDVEALTAHTNLLVVMPDGGLTASYSNWWNGGKGGPPEWETFHLVELRQLLERNWHAGNEWAIAGVSMGGYGAMEYAARHPGMFVAAASYSGFLDPLGEHAAFLADAGDIADLWGDPVAQAAVWKAHDPSDIAAGLRGTALYVAYGNGRPGPLDASSSGSQTDALEAEVAAMNETFVHRLAALKIPVTVYAYGAGTHSWPYWQRDFQRSLPFLLKALGA